MLKAQGIKPGRMTEAPGVANKVLGKGKRWIAIAVLAVLASSFAVMWFALRKDVAEADELARSAPRHQIYGDPVIVKRLSVGTELEEVLPALGDRILACYAQPGKLASLPPVEGSDHFEALARAAKEDLVLDQSEPREIVELKQIVNGMKRELREYLAVEGMTAAGYYNALVERQRAESEIATRVKRELEGVSDSRIWEEKNAQLRKMGLRPIEIPDELF